MGSTEGEVYIPIKNVPLFIQQDAISWHNNVTGDNWTLDNIKHPDIQHRIGMLVDYCDEYKITDGEVVYIGE